MIQFRKKQTFFLCLLQLSLVGGIFYEEYPHRYDDGNGRIGNCAFGVDHTAFATIDYDPTAKQTQVLATIKPIDLYNPDLTGGGGKDRMQQYNNGIPYFNIDACPDCPSFYVGAVNGQCSTPSLDFYAVSHCADWNNDGAQDNFLLLQEGAYFTKRDANFDQGGVEMFTHAELFDIFSIGFEDGAAVLQAQPKQLTPEHLESLNKLNGASVLVNMKCQVDAQPFTSAGTDQQPWKKDPFAGSLPVGWPTDNVQVDHCMTFNLNIKGVAPPKCPGDIHTGSASGDPHFTLFSGDKFDFHGECDLVLLHAPNFGKGLGLDIFIRTKIESSWSFIEAVALRIGAQFLEVSGKSGTNGGRMAMNYWFNGKKGVPLADKDALYISGFPIAFRALNPRQTRFRVDLGHGDAISIDTYKKFCSVNVRARTHLQFQGSTGLMGSFPKGEKVARDEVTVMSDNISFGNEWKVLSNEPMLFHTIKEGSQRNKVCAMPQAVAATTKTRKRRLGEAGVITQDEAEEACTHVPMEERQTCVFDVLATNDIKFAGTFTG